MVRKERLELSILSAVASKTTVYTIPPLAQNCQLKFLMNSAKLVSVCDYYIVYVFVCQYIFKCILKKFGTTGETRTLNPEGGRF